MGFRRYRPNTTESKGKPCARGNWAGQSTLGRIVDGLTSTGDAQLNQVEGERSGFALVNTFGLRQTTCSRSPEAGMLHTAECPVSREREEPW